jgi:hypothetical protein
MLAFPKELQKIVVTHKLPLEIKNIAGNPRKFKHALKRIS